MVGGFAVAIWEKLDTVWVDHTVVAATESRRSKGWWGVGGVAPVGTGGVWERVGIFFLHGRKQDKTGQDRQN